MNGPNFMQLVLSLTEGTSASELSRRLVNALQAIEGIDYVEWLEIPAGYFVNEDHPGLRLEDRAGHHSDNGGRDSSSHAFPTGQANAGPGQRFPEELKDAIALAARTGKRYLLQKRDETRVSYLIPAYLKGQEILSFVFLSMPARDDVLISRVTYLIAIFLNLNRLIQQGQHDALTGLMNRHSFDQKLNTVLFNLSLNESVSDNDRGSYFVLLDLDHFKHVNDRFGHVMGDEVLLRFSRLLEKTFRKTDFTFRYGGEEFALILVEVEENHVEDLLNRLATAMLEQKFPSGIRITFSAGYAKIHAGETSVQVIEKADRALYYAKENGRDQYHDYDHLIENDLIQPAGPDRMEVLIWNGKKAK